MSRHTLTDTDTNTVPIVDPPALSFTPSADLASAVYEAAQAGAELAQTHGVVYLLHFDRPYRHAAHYTGWTTDLIGRLTAHATGRGARLLAVAKAAGIGWHLARTWPGTRHTERALKRQGGASRRCPICGAHPRTTPTSKASDPHPRPTSATAAGSQTRGEARRG